MQLTGKEIVSRNVITGLDLENAVQQQGVDLRLDRVWRYDGYGWGAIPKEGKTQRPGFTELEANVISESGEKHFRLQPGYYEISFMEGCNIPADLVISNIKPRSSLCRCGADIKSGQFDGGFSTEHMGAFLQVQIPIIIEQGARIAQVQVLETRPVDQENLYNGQWQHDKQRGEA